MITHNTYYMSDTKQFLLFLFLLWLISFNLKSQDRVVADQIVAVVGNSIILKSDIHHQKIQYQAQPEIELGDSPECEVFEEALYQKLLYNQAIIDSVEISDEQVEMILDRRLRFFIHQIGSREKLEEYYGKTIEELKDDFRDIVREQELSQKVESNITRNVRVTPSEVNEFFNSLPKNEIPIVESYIEISQIVKVPPVSEEEIANARNRLNRFRERILDGDSFSTLAIMYSDDPGSARRGGELGFINRGEFYREFEAVAFNLQPGEVSEIFETKAGFHIVEKIERRGEQVNVRHILIRPEISAEEVNKTKNKLDSIRRIIQRNEMSFAEAAREFSDHPSKANNGIIINQRNNTTRFKPEEVDPNLFFIVDRMKVGEVSRPAEMMTEDGDYAFRIVHLRNRTQPKEANLTENYDFIKQIALENKRREKVNDWIEDKIQDTYLHINENFYDCHFSHNWLKKYLEDEL